MIELTKKVLDKFQEWIIKEKHVSPIWKPDIATLKLWLEFTEKKREH